MSESIAAPAVVIFDVDGTLLDSVEQHTQAWMDAFSDYGHRVAFEDVRRQIGKGGDQLLPVFLSASEITEYGEQLEAHRSDLLRQRYMSQIRSFAQVRALLQRVRDDGKRVALASSAKKDELEVYKKIANIGDLIDAETSADDAKCSKPFPDIFQAVIQRFSGIDPACMIAVGDTPYDAEAAASAGVSTIGMLGGGWSEADLRRAGCVEVYECPADLLARYDTSPIAVGRAMAIARTASG